MRTWIVCGVALLSACGKKDGGAKEAPPAKTARAADAAVARPDAAPPPPDAAPTPPAPDKLVLEDCAMDGAAVTSSSFSDAAGDLALAPDGSIYVVLAGGTQVRHYRPVDGPTCALALDPGFADHGTLATTDVRALGVDSQGRLLVAANKAITRYVAGKPDASCAFDWTPERLVVAPDDRLLVNTFMDDLAEVTVDAAGCQQTPWTPKVELHHLGSIDRVGDRLLAVYTPSQGELDFVAATFGFDGALRAPLEIVAELGDDRQLCNSAGAIACGGGLCVADANCRALRVYAPDGKWVGNKRFDDYPWVTGIDGPRAGVAYLAITRGDDKQPETYRPVIQRLRGI